MPQLESSPPLSEMTSANPHEVVDYAGDMARHLSNMCEGAGLHGLATLFFAAHGEAARAAERLQRSSARNAATDDAA